MVSSLCLECLFFGWKELSQKGVYKCYGVWYNRRMALKKLNKKRITMRKDRVSLDAKMMGPEPTFVVDDGHIEEQVDGKIGGKWATASRWYNYFWQNKDYLPHAVDFLRDTYQWDDDKLKIFLRLPDYKIRQVGNAGVIASRGYQYQPEWYTKFDVVVEDLFKIASEMEEQRVEEQKEKPKQPTIQERTKAKVLDTIYAEFDLNVVDQWMEGNFKVDFPAFSLFKNFGLKGNAIPIFKDMIELEYNVLTEAYNKTCDQAVEAYSHISKANKKKMINLYDSIFSDLDKLKDSFKATRQARVRAPRSNEQQVSKLNYMKEHIESKLTSINPVLIPGKTRLYVYNTKQGRLIEFFTDSGSGLEITGSTIKNFNPKLSRMTKLRKPEDILPKILNNTEFQNKKLWKQLTTKIYQPTGRINKDCILMRVI